MTLIQQLSEGKIALKNTDGTLENLRKVLKTAFPEDTFITQGKHKYYFKKGYATPEYTMCDLTNLPSHPTSAFIQELNNKSTTMRKITHIQAQSIIDIACATWKDTLFDKWGKQIVLKQEIHVSDSQYKIMRGVCTAEQHKLFDGIFGEDVHKFKVGDYFTVVEECYGYNGKKGHTYEVIKVAGSSLHYEPYNSVDTTRVKVRPATPDEIKKAERFVAKKGDWVVMVKGYFSDFSENGVYQLDRDFVQGETNFAVVADDCGDVNAIFAQYLGDCKFRFATPEEIEKAQYLPEGTPCFVRETGDAFWKLAYANGHGKFFSYGKKSGKQSSSWEYAHEVSKGLPEE